MTKERISAIREQAGQDPIGVNLIEILMDPEELQVRSTNIVPDGTLHTPLLATRFRPHNGLCNMVWMANNDPRESWSPGEIILPGLFMLDEQTRRLLFVPNHPLPSYDAHRSWNNIYTTNKPLLSIVQALMNNGVSLYQATMLRDVESQSINYFPPGSAWEFSAFMGGVNVTFSEQTGLDWKINGYRLESQITLEQILARQFHEVPLLTPADLKQPAKTLAKIAKGWS